MSGGDDAWWDAVYAGPDDEVPDTPHADPRSGSVDDWFEAALGAIASAPGAAAAAPAAKVRTPTVVVEPTPRQQPQPTQQPQPAQQPLSIQQPQSQPPVDPRVIAPRISLDKPRLPERPPTLVEPAPDPDSAPLPETDPEELWHAAPDTVVDSARHGALVLRAASVRGEAARAAGRPRGDRLLLTRFGAGAEGLLALVVAAGPEPRMAEHAARLLAGAVGRNRAELLADLREGAQERLRFGLQRLTARAARDLPGGSTLHALLAPLDPDNPVRAGFGTGPGGLLLLGDDFWYDAYAGRRLAADAASDPDAFRFRAVRMERGDVLLLATGGLTAALAGAPAVSTLVAEHWQQPHAPSAPDFLRQLQTRAQGFTEDRTAVALWQE